MFETPIIAIRTMCKHHVRGCEDLERRCHQSPRTVRCLLDKRKRRDPAPMIGVVAETISVSPQVVGHMVYQEHRDGIDILTLAVLPLHRRCNIGTQLLDTLQSRRDRRPLFCVVSERNLPAQLFLQRRGFELAAVMVVQPHEDSYMFSWER